MRGFIHGYRYIWESKADGNFVVTEDTENEPLDVEQRLEFT